MGNKNSFLLYHDIREPLECLDDAERGKLFLAILNYSEYGIVPDFPDSLRVAFAFIKTKLDRDAQAWNEKSAARSEAGRRGGLAKARNAEQRLANVANLAVPVPVPVPDNESIKEDQLSFSNFIPPTIEEIRSYCTERHNQINAEHFFDYYEARGWMPGNAQMRDWKASVRAWENRDAAQIEQSAPIPRMTFHTEILHGEEVDVPDDI